MTTSEARSESAEVLRGSVRLTLFISKGVGVGFMGFFSPAAILAGRKDGGTVCGHRVHHMIVSISLEMSSLAYERIKSWW
jgi:hypothetical protein